ncbi:hypothetical protein SGFS_017660 [Streptomyces graminofaciens]|uniref:Uncharacterized protein n=1 Tax=Streptomyces graminofaciens TaxID=68212 RepID=A0ABM7F3X5_9ACTN|nr:hypothetical protein SGFS_017660 [Streptomyces graminofaciens]
MGPVQGTARGQVLVEGGAGHKRSGQPRNGAVGVGIVHGHQTGSCHPLGESHLPAETGPKLLVCRLRGVDDLNRYLQP